MHDGFPVPGKSRAPSARSGMSTMRSRRSRSPARSRRRGRSRRGEARTPHTPLREPPSTPSRDADARDTSGPNTSNLSNLALHFVSKLDGVLMDMAKEDAAERNVDPPRTEAELDADALVERKLGRDLWAPTSLPEELRPRQRYSAGSSGAEI